MPGGGAHEAHHFPLRGRRNLRPDRRERARRGCVHRAADQSAGREHHGAPAPDRRGQTGVGRTHHLRDAVLRLFAAGPQGPAQSSDRRQAAGEYDHHGGCQPGAGNRFSPARAAGVLRHSGGPPVRAPGAGFALSQEAVARPGGGGARCGIGEDGAGFREAVERHVRDHRQAQAHGERRGSTERGRRRCRTGLHHSR